MINLRLILVTTDFSDTSRAALRYGIELAQRFGAHIHLLHVSDEPKEVAMAESDGAYRLHWLLHANETRQVQPECVRRVGTPAEEIVRYAQEHAVDLIVMGTHGREGVARVVLGSVAEKVVRTAPCPVLTVHRPERAPVASEEPIRLGVFQTA